VTRSPLRQALWASGWPARSVLLLAIGAYRLTLGQLIGGGCRFHPSCSAYAADAVRNAGALRGAALAVWRILRCSPLSRGGVDHPPARRAWLYDTAIRQDRAA
jgi:uncharacterized protein